MNGLADKLLGSEALALLQAAQLNPDELALVSDMVAQLACHATASPAHQQQQVPGHAGLAAQLEQLLPSLMHQQQQQQQQHAGSPRSLALQQPAAAAPAAAQPVHAPAWQPAPVATRSHPAPTANATGLHSPSSSSTSGRSSPASARSWTPGRAHAAASDHNQQQQQHSAVQQRSVPRRPDAGAQAAAEVLNAALADPTASVDDVVGLFDTMLSVSGSEARVLQQMLVGEDLGLELATLAAAPPPQAPAAAAAPASSWSAAAPAYLCKQQQQEKTAVLQARGGGRQPGHQQLVAAGSMGAWQAAGGGQLNQAQRSRAVSKLESAASAASARSGPASRLHISSARTMHVQANQQQHQQQQWQPAAATASGSRGRASSVPRASSSRLLAGGTPRSHSPTASSLRKTAASAAEAAAAEHAARARSRSCSPLEVEREWLAGLRDASPQRSRSPGRSRSASPPGAARRQQHCAWQSAVAAQYWDAAAALQDSGGAGQRALPPWDSSTRPRRHTSDDDDGGDHSRQPGWNGSSSRRHRTPEPVRLPQDELEQRARRFYERNMDWKRRCGQVYERQKHAAETEATQECTFSPAINRRSEKIVQEAGLKYPMRPIRPLTALADRGWQQQARQQQQQKQQQQQQRRPASTGRIRPPQQAAQQHGQPFSSKSASPCSYTAGQHATPSAVQRLYQDAAVRQSRAEQYRAVTSKAEKQARAWSAPRSRVNEGVSPRLYEHLDPNAASASARCNAAAAAAATVVKGCSFQPWTNPRRAGLAGSRRSASAQRSSRPAAGGDVVCPEAAAAGPSPQQLQDEFVAAFDELVSNSPCHQQPQQQDVDTGSEAPEQQQQKQQQQAGATPDSSSSPRQQRIGSLSRNTDLDWQEFITRQQRFVSTRDAKVAAVASSRVCGRTSPELSPGTKRILAEQRLLYSATGGSPRSPGAAAATRSADGFLGRLEQQARRVQLLGASGSPGSPGSVSSTARPSSFKRQQQHQRGGVPEGCTFKPAITPRAAALKGRSLEEMSEGDRLRREVRLEQQRVVAEARSLDGHTFTPDLSPSRQRGSREWLDVPPRLRLTDEGLAAYMASLDEQRRQLDVRRAVAAKRQQEQELRECTFKPATTPVPAYVSELVDVGHTARYVDKVLQQQHSQQLAPAGAPFQPAADATRPAARRQGIGSCPAGAVVTAVAPAWLSKKY